MSSGSSDLRRPGGIARAAALAAVLLLPALPALGTGLLVSSKGIFGTVPAGGTLVRRVTLTPTDPRPTLVRVTVEAFDMDADGRPEHGPGMRVPLPAARVARIEAIPRRLVLENGQPQDLEVRCEPPEAGGTSWAVVLLEVEPVRTRGRDGETAEVTARIAVPVFVTVEGTQRPDLRVEEMSAVLAAPGRIQWEGLLENRGNTVLKVSGVLAIEERGEELAAEELEGVVILPGSHRRVRGVVRGDFRAAAQMRGHLWVRFGTRDGEATQADCAVLSSAKAGSGQTGRAF